MHIVQSSFTKFTMKSSISPLVRLYSTKQNIKSSRNHYDTLKITPHATQNEVKSAYYKLSLQYHPDKNKSEYAKKKFQDISDAYEILGNHELRKNYDRHMIIRQQPISNVEDPKSQYENNVYSGTSRVYNFDKWTQAHYGKQFRASRARRNLYEEYKQMEDLEYSKEKSNYTTELAFVLLTVSILLMIYFRQDVDVPLPKTKKQIEEIKVNEN